jgi:hypothetical protein
MGKYLNVFKNISSKRKPEVMVDPSTGERHKVIKGGIIKAEGIRNPWGLARYLAQKYRAVPPDIPFKELKQGQQSRIKEFYGAVATPSVQNRRGKLNRVEGTSATFGGEDTKQSAGSKKFNPNTSAGRRNLAAEKKTSKKQHTAWKKENPDAKKTKKSLDVQTFLDFMSEGNISALNKMIFEVDDSPEGLFMQAVRKAMGKHSEQYKDIGKPQFLKKAAKAEPLQKVSPQLVAFLAGLAISDQFVENPRGRMTPSQQREWERSLNSQMKRKSLKDGVSMDDLQKHWSDSSDTYVRRIPVAKGVFADETFLDKKMASAPRPGEIWNPQTHRWTKAGNLGKINVGSGGKKRLRAGSTATGAHQKNVGGLSGKGQLRVISGGRTHRTTVDVAEQARGTKAGVGSGKSPQSVFRTGAKGTIKRPTNKTGSGSFKSKPKTRKTTKRSQPKHLNVNRQTAAGKR